MLYDSRGFGSALIVLLILWSAISIGTCKGCEYLSKKVKVEWVK